MSGSKNRIIYAEDFLRDSRKLPADCQEKLAELLEILRNDPFDPLLHTKPLNIPLRGLFSFRITRDYRVGFKLHETHTLQLLAADRRDKIYQKLKRKL